MLSYPPLRNECQISYQVPKVGFLFLIFALKPLFLKSAEG